MPLMNMYTKKLRVSMKNDKMAIGARAGGQFRMKFARKLPDFARNDFFSKILFI